MTPLIAGLLQPAAYPHQAPSPRLIETHISWVILAGEYAYKLKKPLNLGFLDFSTLDKRRACCAAEIRLNRRLAPDIYLDVVPVTGSPDAPRIGGDGPTLEWAVKMRAFPADATLDREVEVTAEQIDAIADAVAAFHAAVDIAPAGSAFGLPDKVMVPIAANFEHLHALLPLSTEEGRGKGASSAFEKPGSLSPSPSPGGRGGHGLLDRLEAWCHAEGQRLAVHFSARKAGGYIRECHGDLHLGNIAWIPDSLPPLEEGGMKNQGQPLIFDAIEFNPDLRFIDVINEIAFLTMDLRHRGRPDLAWRCLNRYLEHTGDYAGLAALPYYQVYRATVRAKVAAILATQHAGRSAGDFSECLGYLKLADRLAHDRHAALILMHGVSGSGKTWHSQHLLERLGAVRLRSDVERKRLFGLAARDSSAGVPGGIYTREAGERTLASLLAQARGLLSAGFIVIVDATFIRRDWRTPFARLANELAKERRLPWFIAAVSAAPERLRARVAQRMAAGQDASEAGPAVLEAQLAAVEPFTEAEQDHVLSLTEDMEQSIEQIQAHFGRHEP